MESSSDSGDGRRCVMIEVGDVVVYLKDGVRGVVIRIEDGRCHVLWEDDFVSWESTEWLRVESKKQQRE